VRSISSKLGTGTPALLLGRKSSSRRICSSVVTSLSNAPSAIERVACTLAPPSSSAVTTSLVTVFTTSGPVTNM
jgi:hypothetical protein